MAITRLNSTTQVVREAMRIVSRNVIPPRVVREGTVRPVKTTKETSKSK